jgi:hypothetical protein
MVEAIRNLKLIMFRIDNEIRFDDLGIQMPDEWVDENFIGQLQPHLVAFLTALAGILALKLLIRV